MSKLSFTGMFSHYQPIEFDPYYVFTSNKKFLIRCKDYPELISKVSPHDLLNIQGEVAEETPLGTKLINVKFGGSDNE